jgi:hypothetical protein
MNAVLSAETLPWRESAAFKSSLVVGDIDPFDVYQFLGHATFDSDFREHVLADARAALARFRLPAGGSVRSPELVAHRIALDAEEREALDQLALHVHGKDIDGLRAVEGAALREGVGMPAIAALVVVVAIAVLVFVFLYARLIP